MKTSATFARVSITGFAETTAGINSVACFSFAALSFPFFASAIFCLASASTAAEIATKLVTITAKKYCSSKIMAG